MYYEKKLHTGKIIKSLIKKSGVSPLDLSKKLGVTRARIYLLYTADNATLQLIDEILYYIGMNWKDFENEKKEYLTQEHA